MQPAKPRREVLKQDAEDFTKIYFELKQKAAEINASLKEVSEKLIETLDLLEVKEHVATDTNKFIKATVVRSEVSSWDREKLEELLTEEQWQQCHELVFSESALEKVVSDHDDLDPEDLSPAIIVKEKKPYIRTSASTSKRTAEESKTRKEVKNRAKTARKKAIPKGSKK